MAESRLPRFVPVPLARSRRDGWTPERQRAFLRALRDTGVVAAAARSVGMGVTSAYNLRRRKGAESFANAWAAVEHQARDRALEVVMHEAMHGTTRPRFYRGRFVGTRFGFDTQLALRALRAFDAAGRAK